MDKLLFVPYHICCHNSGRRRNHPGSGPEKVYSKGVSSIISSLDVVKIVRTIKALKRNVIVLKY
jgi:hypothetical protein